MFHFEVSHPDPGRFFGTRGGDLADTLYDVGLDVSERASRMHLAMLRRKLPGVGLGKLGYAVGQTSARQRRQRPRDPWGATYAKGGDESRAGGALEAYGRGTVIRARQGKWLAISTNVIPRLAGPKRKRMTPALYKSLGFEQRLGPLEFWPINSRIAAYVINNVTLHPGTYRAKRAGPGNPRTRIKREKVIAFWLIRITSRGQRFDKDASAAVILNKTPEWAAEALDRRLARR